MTDYDPVAFVAELWAEICPNGVRLLRIVEDGERGGVSIVDGGGTVYAHIPPERLEARDEESTYFWIRGQLRNACQDVGAMWM